MSDKKYQEINDWLEGTQNIEEFNLSYWWRSCVLHYDASPADEFSLSERSICFSIILATDNVPSGKQTFTLEEALDIAKKAHIDVDALLCWNR